MSDRPGLAAGPEAPRFSVIVCTRDRPQDIARCVPSILATVGPSFELIVVEQSTTDAAERVVAALADPRIVLLRDRSAGKARGENAAVARARGDVLAFTDDDCTVPTDWLRRAWGLLEEDREAGIIFSAVVAAPHDPNTTFVPTFLPSVRQNPRFGIYSVVVQ